MVGAETVTSTLCVLVYLYITCLLSLSSPSLSPLLLSLLSFPLSSPSLSPLLLSLLSFPPLIHVTGEYERVQKKAFTNWINSHLLKV